MAIVDAKHTQTIEELVSKLGEGGSSSSSPIVIHVTEQTGATEYACDTPFSVVRDAILAGNYNITVAFMNNVNGGYVAHLCTVNYSNDIPANIVFGTMNSQGVARFGYKDSQDSTTALVNK